MTIKMVQPKTQQVSKKMKQDIQQQLHQTMTTLRLLPLDARDRPNMPKSSWGDFKQIAMLSSSQYRTPIRRKATPKEISEMDFWLIALGNLPEDERRIAMARACGISWRRLEEIDGRSHTTLRKIEAKALQRLGTSIGREG